MLVPADHAHAVKAFKGKTTETYGQPVL